MTKRLELCRKWLKQATGGETTNYNFPKPYNLPSVRKMLLKSTLAHLELDVVHDLFHRGTSMCKHLQHKRLKQDQVMIKLR